MKKLIDMGKHHGERVFYTNKSSLAELLQAGEIVAIPDTTQGIVYKRTENCSPVEMASQLSLEEAKKITDEWNEKLG